MKKKLALILLLNQLFLLSNAQNKIIGNFPLLKAQKITLLGFDGMRDYIIDTIKVSDDGSFCLKYTDQDYGMGFIIASDNKPYFVFLNKETIKLKGASISNTQNVIVLEGEQNKALKKYTLDHQNREQALRTWKLLSNVYSKDSLYLNEKSAKAAIINEIKRINKQDSDFLTKPTNSSYLKWYLSVGNIISSVFAITQSETELIPSTINAFRKLDYSNPFFNKSGLMADVLESQYWLIENSGQPLDTVFKEMIVSTDSILSNISKNEKLYNEITKYLFNYFERHSLIKVSEYLAVKALTQNSCSLNSDVSSLLESYRSMKKGNKAPEIIFNGDVFKSGIKWNNQMRLSDIESKFKLIIFGASWCYKCEEEIPELATFYEKWKSKGVEIIFISLDTEKQAFESFSSRLPFITSCDYKTWETKAAKDYYITSSPTYFLLDNKDTILARPISVQHIDSLIQYSE